MKFKAQNFSSEGCCLLPTIIWDNEEKGLLFGFLFWGFAVIFK